ncbi:uncharacterized protein Bfra_004127 [Botrytis fragariae]|uniref:Uncharacterized protein n=1 Tax=Botrytis fragariae TaxID=1964551 RepID=A0A8H6AVB0_9HELO|nr:uncharacterized protein Bfra_004127 [Botrytis fragariae]KAF5874120.1 hypothetical protein Bfra_004127 [Botrytis fragariae]
MEADDPFFSASNVDRVVFFRRFWFSSSRQSVSACCFFTKVPAHLPNYMTWISSMLYCVLRHLEETHKRCGGTE